LRKFNYTKMLDTPEPINIINKELQKQSEDLKTTFLVVFEYQDIFEDFAEVIYLATFDTFNEAVEYIKTSPSYNYLKIQEVKQNLIPLSEQVCEYGTEVVYDIQTKLIKSRRKLFYPLDKNLFEFHQSSRSIYCVSCYVPIDDQEVDQTAITIIENNKDQILDNIAFLSLQNFQYMIEGNKIPDIEAVIDYEKRIVKLRLLGLEFGTFEVKNFLTHASKILVQEQYKRYLKDRSAEINRLIVVTKKAIDSYS
jgi:hypothetical protein